MKERGYLIYLLPLSLVIVLVLVIPLAFSFYVTFFDYRLMEESRPFVGLENYRAVLNTPEFWNSMRFSFSLVACAVSVELIFGLGIAILFSSMSSRLFEAESLLIQIPVMISGVGIGILWRVMYDQTVGILNFLLKSVGLPTSTWISSPSTVFPSVVIMDLWAWTPFVAMILYAGVQMIPRECYEAANVDGASAWHTFRHITLPLLKGSFLVVIIFRSAECLRVFDEINVSTFGGPMRMTETISMYIFRSCYEWFNVSKASVASFILVLIVLAIYYPLIRVVRKGAR